MQKRPQNRRRKEPAAAERRAEKRPLWTVRTRLSAAVAFGFGVGIALVLSDRASFDTPIPEPVPLRLAGEEKPAEVASPLQLLAAAAPADAEPLRAKDLLPSEGLDPRRATLDADARHYVQTVERERVTLTLVPEVQQAAEKVLRTNQVPYGALVALDPKTGAVLALVSHSEVDPSAPQIALQATQPAASTFKVITAAALVETTGLTPQTTECVRGGRSSITADLLVRDAKRDTLCHSLAQAMAASTNVVFARLGTQHLTPEKLGEWAQAFGYDTQIPFELPVEPSRAELPSGRVEFAGAAAGFHFTYLSPLHGALIAASIANGGVMMEPHLVSTIEREAGVTFRQQSAPWRRVVAPQTASALAEMMARTGRPGGTAYKHIQRAGAHVRHVAVAGKTGSLSSTCADGKKRHNSWFIGYAPADAPVIAVAALVVNDPKWKLKSTPLALAAIDAYLATMAPPPSTEPQAPPPSP